MDLAPSSPGQNFGDPAFDPDASIGHIGQDGFVVQDGPCRDGSNHDVGAFQD
jgi:hypothetical protein